MSTNADSYWEGWEPIRAYLEQERLKMGWGDKQIRQWLNMKGHDSHLFSTSQWKFLLPEQYKTLQERAQGEAFQREYDELKREYNATRSYFDNTHENMTDVWSYPRVTGHERYGHPTPKPIAMMERILKSSSPPNSVIYDPFLGSGPTIIGAERTGRRCYGIEIYEPYVDAVLQRWEQCTGRKAHCVEVQE